MSKNNILIVDDDENIAELISLYLNKECYETEIAASGTEALQLFEEYGSPGCHASGNGRLPGVYRDKKDLEHAYHHALCQG